MLDNWVFAVGFFELLFGILLYGLVTREQFKTFKHISELQPLKRLLLSAVAFMILSSLPLMFVYADTVWFRATPIWVVYTAVILNATSHVVTAYLLLLVYRFKLKDDDL